MKWKLMYTFYLIQQDRRQYWGDQSLINYNIYIEKLIFNINLNSYKLNSIKTY
jgi:hypothetical protein